MKSMRTWLMLPVVIVCLSLSLAGQVQTSDLRVTVKDPNGAVVRNATVIATEQARGLARSTSTNADGQYIFLSLTPGLYTIEVRAEGFAKVISKDVRLTIGQVAELPISLSVAGSNETVTVSSEAELVETQQTSSQTTIDQTRIDNLPINGRNYVNFALTNSQLARDTAPSIGAAPTSGLNIGGQRARSNLVNIDGTNAVDNSTNGIRSTVSQDAVQEFQVITNGYQAEYGQASGGVINIISRSGTNNFHGSAYGYLRNRKIQAVNPFSNVSDPAYTRVQAGMTAGGALKKDRTFYFFSFETTRRHETGFNDIGANNFGLNAAADITPFVNARFQTQLPAGTVTAPATQGQADFLAFLAAHGQFNQQTIGYAFIIGTSGPVAITGVNPLSQFLHLGPGFFFAPTLANPFVPLPQSYVALQSITGNFPVSEATDIYSLRLDHRLTNNQTLMFRGSVSPSNVNGIEVNAQGPQNFGQNAWSRTSVQDFHDFSILGEHTWTIGSNKVNEFRFQYARRGLNYTYSHAPGGSNVAVNIPGFAFFGREPFSYVQRTEQRWEQLDNFSITKGSHNIKFGVDNNYLPLTANFTVNFGGIYDFGQVDLGGGAPPINPIQAYGAGLPQYLVQGVGNPHDQFSNDALGLFAQDSWRITKNVTVNYGLRYDVEFTPTFPATTAIADAAQKALNITKGIPRSTKNFAPRIGVAWDPYGDGKTVVRGSYGLFYDHPLMALAFDSDVADASRAPQLLLTGGSPSACNIADPIGTLNAANAFMGTLTCLPPSFTYLADQQRFNPAANTQSIWINQNYLTANPPVPLASLPFSYPTAANFKYAYSNQANFAVEHDFGHDLSLSLQYNFNGGRRLNRPINVNAPHGELIVQNWLAAVKAGAVDANSSPLAVATAGVGPLGPYIPAALVNFFRPSGFNPTLTPYAPPQVIGLSQSVLSHYGLGFNVPVPFSDAVANLSNGTSVYHGFTANLRKRFSTHYEFLASYTWSHTIDDGVDLQATVAPQNNYNPNGDRSTSLFDQRHRFVFSGVYQSGHVGNGLAGGLLSNWTLAPIIEVASGRPFNIVSGFDQNFDFGATTDRPNTASKGQTDACGDVAVASKYSPTGYLIPTCYADALVTGVVPNLNGNLQRNAGTKPITVFTDLRVSRRFKLYERAQLEGIMDVFNLINKNNVADVNPLWNQAGTPTAAYDPRQFQFALRLTW